MAKNSSITVLDASIKMSIKLFEANQKVRAGSRSIHERNQLLENVLELPGLGLLEGQELGPARLQHRRGQGLRGGEPLIHHEHSCHEDDGRLVWADACRLPLRDRSGQAVGAVVTFLDITGRRGMEGALAAKNAELDRYLSSALDLLCIANMEGRLLRGKLEWKKVLGYENLYRRMDGGYRWIEGRSRPEGEGIYAAARDVTDRKLAEEAGASFLREQEILLQEVHHRSKSNMNTITSLPSLQAMSMKDGAALEAAGRRGRGMKVLYERIYEAPVFGSRSVRNYLDSLVEGIIADFPNREIVDVAMEVEDFPWTPGSFSPWASLPTRS